MKVQAIYLRQHRTLGDISIDFRVGGRVASAVCITGACGSGKTLLLGLVAQAWAGSVKQRGYGRGVDAKSCRVDFEVDGEVAVVHIRRDRVEGSGLIAKKFGDGKFGHWCGLYEVDRAKLLVSLGAESYGARSLYPMLADIHERQPMRDSVVMIDEFEEGLDKSGVQDAWKYLYKHYLSLGNQLIVTSRSGFMHGCLEVGLKGRVDPLESALKIAGK